jgi:hypothetical protein
MGRTNVGAKNVVIEWYLKVQFQHNGRNREQPPEIIQCT